VSYHLVRDKLHCVLIYFDRKKVLEEERNGEKKFLKAFFWGYQMIELYALTHIHSHIHTFQCENKRDKIEKLFFHDKVQ
jgi:hypothetical protein